MNGSRAQHYTRIYRIVIGKCNPFRVDDLSTCRLAWADYPSTRHVSPYSGASRPAEVWYNAQPTLAHSSELIRAIFHWLADGASQVKPPPSLLPPMIRFWSSPSNAKQLFTIPQSIFFFLFLILSLPFSTGTGLFAAETIKLKFNWTAIRLLWSANAYQMYRMHAHGYLSGCLPLQISIQYTYITI